MYEERGLLADPPAGLLFHDDLWVRKLLAAVLVQAIQDARMAPTQYERTYPGVVEGEARDAILWLFTDHRSGYPASMFVDGLGFDLCALRRKLLAQPRILSRCQRMRLACGFPPRSVPAHAHFYVLAAE